MPQGYPRGPGSLPRVRKSVLVLLAWVLLAFAVSFLFMVVIPGR
jgi:hypothetical protein